MSEALITQADIDAMLAILDSGDRAGAYLYYYDLIRDIDREAANQILMQMQITTYSGFFGGAALIGNSIAKDSNPDKYPETLDFFSEEIVRGLISAIEAQINLGSSGILTVDDIRDADRGVWASFQMENYFPGNVQFPANGSNFYSEGTLAAALAGLQITFGSSVGNRADQFAGAGYQREETADYVLIRDAATGRIVYVEDKLGLVDAATGGLHDNPAGLVVNMGILALAAIVVIGAASPVWLGAGLAAALLGAFVGTVGAIQSNDAAAQAVGVGLNHLLSPITDEIAYDANAAFLLKQFVGREADRGGLRVGSRAVGASGNRRRWKNTNKDCFLSPQVYQKWRTHLRAAA